MKDSTAKSSGYPLIRDNAKKKWVPVFFQWRLFTLAMILG